MKQLVLSGVFILVSLTALGQTKTDTLLRKKYVDSLKRELASYKLQSYSMLNEYEKVANENTKLKERNQCLDNTILKMEEDFYKKTRSHGYVFAGLALSIVAMFFIAGHK